MIVSQFHSPSTLKTYIYKVYLNSVTSKKIRFAVTRTHNYVTEHKFVDFVYKFRTLV
jgi:hypothetical protein